MLAGWSGAGLEEKEASGSLKSAQEACKHGRFHDPPRAHAGAASGCHQNNTVATGRTQKSKEMVYPMEVQQLQ
jgi:hypothetical protein